MYQFLHKHVQSVIKQCVKTEIGQRFEIVLGKQEHFWFEMTCWFQTESLFLLNLDKDTQSSPVWILFKNGGLVFLKTQVIYPRCRSTLSETTQSGWHEPVTYLATSKNPSLNVPSSEMLQSHKIIDGVSSVDTDVTNNWYDGTPDVCSDVCHGGSCRLRGAVGHSTLGLRVGCGLLPSAPAVCTGTPGGWNMQPSRTSFVESTFKTQR